MSWHGWEMNDVSYSVMKHDRRKSVMLYRTKGSVGDAVAYFRDEEMAREFLSWFDDLAHEAQAFDSEPRLRA